MKICSISITAAKFWEVRVKVHGLMVNDIFTKSGVQTDTELPEVILV